jgi:hypothetical protein
MTGVINSTVTYQMTTGNSVWNMPIIVGNTLMKDNILSSEKTIKDDSEKIFQNEEISAPNIYFPSEVSYLNSFSDNTRQSVITVDFKNIISVNKSGIIPQRKVEYFVDATNQEELIWFQDNFKNLEVKYKDKWIAIFNNKVVSNGSTFGEVWSDCNRNGYSEPFIVEMDLQKWSMQICTR